jgi:hypothetical protein
MSRRPLRTHGRRFAIGMSLMLAAAALALPASANTVVDGNRAYRASVAPSVVCATTSATSFSVTLLNTSTRQQLGSANVTPGFGVDNTQAPTLDVSGRDPKAKGTAGVTPVGGTLELRNLGLLPGGSVVVTFSGAPAANSYPMGLVVKQANDFSGVPGNDLILFGDAPTVTVSAGCKLTFLTQPGDATTGQLVPGTTSAASFPQVQVQNSAGTDLSIPNVSISMTLGGGDSTALGGTKTVETNSAGTATFDNLTVSKSGFDYTLTASGLGAPITSHTFDVADAFDTCDVNDLDPTCETTYTSETGFSVTGTGTATTDDGRIIINLVTSGEECDRIDGVVINTIPESVQVAGLDLVDKGLIFDIPESIRKATPNNGVNTYQLCLEPVGAIPTETRSFFDRFTGNQVIGQYEYDQLEEKGVSVADKQVRGWLPDCKGGSKPVEPPCVVSRSGTDDGGVAIAAGFGSTGKFMR